MSEEEKQVLPHGMAVILASSAHAVGARVPKIKAETLACLGNAIVHSAQKGKELMGGWLPSGASDPDDQEDYDEEDSYCREQRGANGDTLRKQGERLLKRAISEGIKEERWDIVGSAADGLVECYAAIEPTESAKMMMLRQSCRVSSKFYDLFKTACGQKNRELLFLQQQERLKEEFLHPSVSSSYVQNHAYLSATSQVWKKLDCSASVESILENFPPSTCCLLIDADENLKKLYAGILRRVPEKGHRLVSKPGAELCDTELKRGRAVLNDERHGRGSAPGKEKSVGREVQRDAEIARVGDRHVGDAHDDDPAPCGQRRATPEAVHESLPLSSFQRCNHIRVLPLDFTAVRRQGKNLPMHCTLSRHCG